ncbi:hypothetical protein PCPL58_p5032 (plasmid) [Pseudomonas cerasi]|nr:hypothetical protein PCPL58_p5032 [Pseudomonas cerasi]
MPGIPWLTAHFADHTFEVDFVSVGNVGTVVSVLGDVYKDGGTIATSKAWSWNRATLHFSGRAC